MSVRRFALATAAVLALAVPAPAAAAPETILQDDAVLLHRDEPGIRAALDRIRGLGVDRVRITAGWSVIAPQPDAAVKPDFDAADPAAYPPANWSNLDRAVRLAHAAGLRVMIDIAFWAPRWATHDDPQTADRLRTDIDPTEYALFSEAVARRYAGGYVPPAPPAGAPAAQPAPSPDGGVLEALLGGGSSQPAPAPAAAPDPAPEPLPAVDVFTIWNEPNHPGFLQPQWIQRDGAWVPRSPDVYRAMVRAAYPAIKAAAPASRVLIGATSSTGSKVPGQSGVPPLAFLRALACVDDHDRPIATGDCAGFTTLPGDGWAHHPYSLRTLPDAQPRNPDDLPVAATPRLAAELRRLVARGRLAPGNADLWLTEYGYETNLPDPQARFSQRQQPGLLAWAEYLGTRDPAVKSWPQFLLDDRPGDPAGPAMRPFGDWQSGLFTADGAPKPAAATFRTPTFAACAGPSRRPVTLVWGRLRGATAGTVRVELRARAASWRSVPSAPRPARAASARAASVTIEGRGDELLRFVPWQRGATYRLRWTAPDGSTVDGPAVAPVGCAAGAR
jgi:hypothetical protein